MNMANPSLIKTVDKSKIISAVTSSKAKSATVSKSGKKTGGSLPSLFTAEKLVLRFQFDKARDERGESKLKDTEFDSLLAEYLRFLTLKIAFAHVQPSDTIDHLWHAHILCTSAYAAFAARHVFIHHNPVGGTVSGYIETISLYKKTFGTAAPKKFWPSTPPSASVATTVAATSLIKSTTTTAATKAKKKSGKVPVKIAPKAAKKSSITPKAAKEEDKYELMAKKWKKAGATEKYKNEFLIDAALGYGPGGRRGGYSGCN